MSLALSGLVAFAIVLGGTATYESIMRDRTPVTFHVLAEPGPRAQQLDLQALTGWHNAWFAYVTGDGDRPPVSFGASTFTVAEYTHMADVRTVFIGARIVAVAGAIIAALVVLLASRRGRIAAVVLVRDAAIAASIGSAVVAVAAAVAFDPLFLLFHEIFFPQGNFLFPPRLEPAGDVPRSVLVRGDPAGRARVRRGDGGHGDRGGRDVAPGPSLDSPT